MSAKSQTVHVRVNDKTTGQPTPCRVRFAGQDGAYYAPFGRLTEFATGWGQDVGGNLWLADDKKYAHIDGSCEIQLPPGPIHVEVSKGFEYLPIHQQIDLKPGQLSIRLTLERWHNARDAGWYSGDIHVETMTPHAALLEAAAEDVAVVNLLARATFINLTDDQPVEAIPNILAFSGQKAALEAPGHMVVVNTLNWHPALGELLLLNCHRVVYPLFFGSPYSLDDWTFADWCDQCHRKAGLVVSDGRSGLPELLLGKVNAYLAALDVSKTEFHLDRHHDLRQFGYRLPLVAGSGKGSNRTALGEARTYARLLPDEPFTYRNWTEAVRAGRTFISNGPLLYLTVNGQDAGSYIEVDIVGEIVHVHAEVHSAYPVDRFFIRGLAEREHSVSFKDGLVKAVFDFEMPINTSGWIEAGCFGEHCVAQATPIFVKLQGHPPVLPSKDSLRLLTKELGDKLSWSSTQARCATEQQRGRLVGVFLAAKEELERRGKANN